MGQCARQLGAAGDAELGVDVPEVRFDGFTGDEESLRNPGVAVALEGKLRDAALGDGERFEAAGGGITGAAAGGTQLDAGALDECGGSAMACKLDRFIENAARVGAAIGAAKCGAEIGKAAGVFESGR